jgi:lipoprotein-releasing system ATP-binding protein
MQLAVEGVGHQFAGTPMLFSGVTARFDLGRVYAVTGPSGSGKSTFLGLLAGWISPTQGRVVRELAGPSSWVFQNPHGVGSRTALDHVCLPLLARGARRVDAERDAMALLSDLGLEHKARTLFQQLSGGEAQRLMLARALAAAPEVLLVDEPTAQLDAVTALEVIGVLQALGGRGCAVVIATHDSRAAQACDDTVDLGLYR